VEALAGVVEIHHGVGEGVSQRVMQRLVGIGGVEAFLDQPTSQHLGSRLVPRQVEGLVRFAPHVAGGCCEAEAFVGADAVGRDDVLLEILVLVVAPHQDEVGPEGVERGAGLLQPSDQIGAVARRRRGALVVAPLGAHGLGPAGRALERLRQLRILQHAFQDPRHALVWAGEGWVVRYSESEDFGHGVS